MAWGSESSLLPVTHLGQDGKWTGAHRESEQPTSPTRAWGETKGPRHRRGSKHVPTVFGIAVRVLGKC